MLKTVSTAYLLKTDCRECLVSILKVRRIKKLTKQVDDFYKEAKFIPRPSIINLYNVNCITRIADDLSLFGNDKMELRNKIIKLL